MSAGRQFTQDTLAEITARAATDLAFRRALVENPARALADNGFAKPAGVHVRFVEPSSAADLVVTLPEYSAAPRELSEDELEAVAGGTDDGITEKPCVINTQPADCNRTF